MNRLKAFRVLLGLTQQSLSAQTGIPLGRLSQIERGLVHATETERRLLMSVLAARQLALQEYESRMVPEGADGS